MRKVIPFIIGAAVVAPLYLATPANAQSYDDIQELEERVQEERNRGNWALAQQLNIQLNMARLNYQKRHGLPEYSDNPVYYQGNRARYQRNQRRYYPNYQGGYYQNQRGYYDQWGNWHSY